MIPINRPRRKKTHYDLIHEENDYPKGAPSCSIDNVLQQEQNHQKKELVRLATIL